MNEDTYEEVLTLLSDNPQPRIVVATGEDLFNEEGELLYESA
jgi:hypothetical protein